MLFTAQYESPLGTIGLVSDGVALTGLRFGVGEETAPAADVPAIADACRWLDLYFSGLQPGFLPPLNLVGTAFRQRVWQALMEIPYGATATYGAIARHVGCRSAQAVGQAVGSNPMAIIVPCHRVVGSGGALTGYAYGVERKEYLLQLEAGRHASAATASR